MHFSKALTTSALLAFPFCNALTAPQLVQSLEQIADSSAQLAEQFGDLTIETYSLAGAAVIQSLEDIISAIAQASALLGLGGSSGPGGSSSGSGPSPTGNATTAAAAMAMRPQNSQHKKRQSQPAFSDTSDAYYVCETFRDFVKIHQQLLAVIIGQHGLLAQTPLLEPVAGVLRTFEGVVDTLAFGVIDAVPPCSAPASSDKRNLDQSLQQANGIYSR
ncbi:MAG: hypothetical protein M1820_005533 [Bogoriella megaspora]|nr:MAG: hypothetical protein M1820_005533 [Bogoriella megaspora]